MADASEAKLLVRAYSFEAEERLPAGSHTLSLAHLLAERQGSQGDAQDPWRRFFQTFDSNANSSDNPICQILDVETKQLREKWKAFVESSSTSDRVYLRASEPTMNGVIDTVRKLQRNWDTRRNNSRLAKTSRLFHKFCSTLNGHKVLIQILPSGNEYVSIFTGTLNAVIQASSNHEKIAEGLSEALCMVSQYVDDCKTDLELFNMEDMQTLVANLYAHMFLLLTSIMDWMMKKRIKRLLDSFNENLPNIFDHEMRKIKGISDRIRNLASQKSRAELRSTRLTVESTARDVRAGLEGEKRHQAEMEHYADSILREQSRLSGLWTAEKQQQLADSIVNMLEERAFLSEYTSEAIAISSGHLEDFFHRDRVRLPCDAFDSIMVPPESFREISDWARTPAPNLLWLEGPPVEGDDFENPVTMMAATVIALAEKTKLPVISYFCELRRGEKLRDGNDTMEAQAMLSLVYALIRQLIELLLPSLETSIDISEGRFKALNGSLGTWSQATALLTDLGGLMPGPVLCIIDGFHWLTDRGTDNYLSDLLKILRGDKWKVLLFTTAIIQKDSGAKAGSVSPIERCGGRTREHQSSAILSSFNFTSTSLSKPKMRFFWLDVGLAVFASLVAASQNHHRADRLTVNTTNGPITGHLASNASVVIEYLGIPYAKPPVGDLRFAPPVQFTSNASYDASNFGFDCPLSPSKKVDYPDMTPQAQRIISYFASGAGTPQSEDCLTLNIWAKPANKLHSSNKPVIVFFYGGRFAIGNTNSPFYNGKYFADAQDVVVVTVNYRINIFGFPGIPGQPQNLGLRDQRAAVKWVHANIASFGGDPSKITIAGQSSGGVSVDYWSYAYTREPIVNGLIAPSGNAFSFPLNSPGVPERNWNTVVGAVNCTDSEDVLACMREKDWEDIKAAAAAVKPTSSSSVLRSIPPFYPIVDNEIVFPDYVSLTKNGSFAKLPILFGNNNNEDGYYRIPAYGNGVVPTSEQVTSFLLESFTCPNLYQANARLAQGVPAWIYRYFGDWDNTRLFPTSGAYHGVDLHMIFGASEDVSGIPPSDAQRETTKVMQRAWAAFANGPGNGLSQVIGWPKFNPETDSLVLLALDNNPQPRFVKPDVYGAPCSTVTMGALATPTLSL
ncbi:carboxylesterase [Colletotrichum chrysophilum]|uniref:Carboxylesterase n=1 Tax=Colletotrichum chrysophilum TaxID=1836956 RepID=A0AAD9EFT3_9PEZI|nr:carboxylesterase [Colletotrichum chrysophilum]